MGIFFDSCDALIDPQTGRALTGEALANAQQDPKWPRCKNRVSKRARFCNACGKAAPGGWWKCPSCGKWIGNDSRFCPHCNQPLYPEDRAAMAGGVWRKEPELFAQRFEVGDVKRLLREDLQVQEGTCAIVMDGGRVHGILESGRHNPDSLARRINWFGDPPPRSVVLVHVGEVAVPMHIEGLRTSEHFPIEFYGELMLRFKGDKESARMFVANVLGSNRFCTFKEISDRFVSGVRVAVDEMCVTSTVEDLVRDPDRRIRLQERMSARLREDLAANGLELVRVSSAEFTGDEYETCAEQLGDLDIKRRETEYRAALRRMADKETMDQYRDADSLRAYKETIDHEYRVSRETRDREFELLKREYEHDDANYRRLVEIEDVEHSIKVERLKAEARRLESIGDAETAAKIRIIAQETEKKVSDMALDLRERETKIEAERKAADAARRKSMPIEELLADIDDVVQREHMLELYKMKLQAGMTPDQILATMGKTDHNDEFLRKMEDLYREAGERIDRNFAKSMEPAIAAANHQTQIAMPFVK